MKFIIISSLIILVLYTCYSVFSTVIMRLFSIRLQKKVNQANGVLLTFDDGPHPVYTPQLLDVLRKHDIQAVFFVVGELAEKHPEIMVRMHREGHAIGIHHYTHTSSWQLTPWQLKRHLVKTEKVIRSFTKEAVVFYRPPWGHFNLSSPWMTKRYQTLLWSHIYKDWSVANHQLHLLETKAPEAGAILLFHDNGDTKGADEQAPEMMLIYLKAYIQANHQRNIPFTKPKEVISSI